MTADGPKSLLYPTLSLGTCEELIFMVILCKLFHLTPIISLERGQKTFGLTAYRGSIDPADMITCGVNRGIVRASNELK